MWTFRPGQGLTKAAYFRVEEWENQPVLSEAEYYEKLKTTFAAVLPNYLRGPRRVAVSLTGGLDSRMVMAWSPASPFKLDTYTFGGPYRDSADVTIARAVARICQQRHHVIPLTQRFFSEFAGLAKRSVVFTDGALDITGSPGLWANRLARQIAPVRLTGNYGDEILRGHICFRPNPPSSALFDASFVPMVTAASRTYTNERQGRQLSFVAFKQMPWHHYARYALEQSQLTIRSPYLDNELVATAFQAPESLRASIDLALQIIAEGDRQLANVPTDRGQVARKGSFRSRILGFYQGFTTRAEYAYDYGMPQWLATADHSLGRLQLEHLFLGRHKYYHFRVWYRDQLAKFVENILLDRRTLSRPYLNRNEVQRIVAAHVSGRENHTRALHKLISSEYIHRALLD
jgi:asparagine synthase (glutamine-hydrolysing)